MPAPSAPPGPGYSQPRPPLASHRSPVPPQPTPSSPRRPGHQSRHSSPHSSHAAQSSWLTDVTRGAVLGDFATELHLPGAVTHVALGFVPGIGTLMALRDLVACWLDADRLGMLLNLLALIPVVGGVPKTLDVLHGLHRVRRHLQRSARFADSGVTQEEIRRKRGRRLRALAVSLLMPVLGLLAGVGTISALHLLFTQTPVRALNLPGERSALTGNGPLVVTLVVASVELLIGEMLCIRARAWLGLLLWPPALLLGLVLPTLWW